MRTLIHRPAYISLHWNHFLMCDLVNRNYADEEGGTYELGIASRHSIC